MKLNILKINYNKNMNIFIRVTLYEIQIDKL